MKPFIFALFVAITFFFTNQLLAQTLEKKAFKEASTIRLYVNDPSGNAAIVRFTDFINKTSWTVQPSSKTAVAKTSQAVDTMLTNTGSLFDFMMGEFQGQLQFYADTDSSKNIYIAVSGYASNLSWGGSEKAKMKKGGPDTNWAQRSLFKQVAKHLTNFPNVNSTIYSNE